MPATPLSFLSHRPKDFGGPVFLLLDDFELAASPQIAAELVELLARCDHLRLVVAGRWTDGIEDLALHLVPVTTLGEDDLAFSAADTLHVLRDVDPAMSELDAARVHHELGGWPFPSAIWPRFSPSPRFPIWRARPRVRWRRRALLLGMALSDQDLEIVGPFSMVKKLDIEIADLLLNTLDLNIDGDAASVLERLQHLGILSPVSASLPSDGRLLLRWSSHLRAVIQEDFVHRHSEQIPHIEGALAHWYAAHGAPGLALTHAGNAQQWDLVISLLNTYATRLFSVRPDAVTRVLVMAPQDVIPPNTIASVLRTIALELPIDAQDLSDPQRLTPVEVDHLVRSPHTRQALESHLWLLTLFRARCLFDQAGIAHDNVRA